MFRLGSPAHKPIDQLRPGLLQVMLHRLRAFNDNTRRLLRLLEDTDWANNGARVLKHVRDRIARS